MSALAAARTIQVTDELQSEIKELTAEINADEASAIDSMYKIGLRLLGIVTDRTGRYGANPHAALKKLLPLSRDGIRPYLKLAQAFDPQEIERLKSYSNPETGERLNRSHVVALTRVSNDKARVWELAEWAVGGGKSTKSLVKEVITRAGGPKSQGGRKPKKSTSASECVDDVLARTKTYENAARQSWLGDGGLLDLYQRDLRQNSWRPTREFVARVNQARAQVEALALVNAALMRDLSALAARADAQLRPKSIL